MIATVFAIFITHALRSFAVIYYSSQNAVSTGCFGITSKRQIVQVMNGSLPLRLALIGPSVTDQLDLAIMAVLFNLFLIDLVPRR